MAEQQRVGKQWQRKPAKAQRNRSNPLGSIDAKTKILVAFRKHFPKDTVDVTDGYKGNIHVVVVSREFDSLAEYDRQGWLRDIIESAGLTKTQISKITLLLAYSPGELK